LSKGGRACSYRRGGGQHPDLGGGRLLTRQ
jgi:hypothetical protein